MGPTLLLIVYCVLIAGASFAGGYVPLLFKLTHTRMQVLMSAVAGFMFGVAVLHMLGHALLDGPAQDVLLWMLVGFLVMFFTERFFHFHSHDTTPPEAGHAHEHEYDHHHDHVHHGHANPHAHSLSWTGATIGMTVHSLTSGIALAAAVAAESAFAGGPIAQATTGLAGIAVFLAIIGHKPLDSLTVVSLATAAGYRKSSAQALNIVFALVEPLGVLLFYLGLTTLFQGHPTFLAYVLAFSAGTFICIALSDLLPEVQFHQHDRLKLSASLVLGLVLAYGTGLIEQQFHDHSGHDHAGHDHGSHDADLHPLERVLQQQQGEAHDHDL
jgi:zinc and cadmium transporter